MAIYYQLTRKGIAAFAVATANVTLLMPGFLLLNEIAPQSGGLRGDHLPAVVWSGLPTRAFRGEIGCGLTTLSNTLGTGFEEGHQVGNVLRNRACSRTH